MKGEYFAHLESKTYQTKYRQEFITITSDVELAIKNSGVKRGSILIQTHHTTCGIWVNENEKKGVGLANQRGLLQVSIYNCLSCYCADLYGI